MVSQVQVKHTFMRAHKYIKSHMLSTCVIIWTHLSTRTHWLSPSPAECVMISRKAANNEEVRIRVSVPVFVSFICCQGANLAHSGPLKVYLCVSVCACVCVSGWKQICINVWSLDHSLTLTKEKKRFPLRVQCDDFFFFCKQTMDRNSHQNEN